jgi:hypothetical protein
MSAPDQFKGVAHMWRTQVTAAMLRPNAGPTTRRLAIKFLDKLEELAQVATDFERWEESDYRAEVESEK